MMAPAGLPADESPSSKMSTKSHEGDTVQAGRGATWQPRRNNKCSNWLNYFADAVKLALSLASFVAWSRA